MKNHFYFSANNLQLYFWMQCWLHGVKGNFVLLGKSGTGKSVFLRDLTISLEEKGLTVRTIGTEDFVDALLKSIRTGNTGWFDALYKEDADVLIFENIEDLRGRETTKMELTSILVKFQSKRKKLIICSTVGDYLYDMNLKLVPVYATKVTRRIIMREAKSRSVKLKRYQIRALRRVDYCSLKGMLNMYALKEKMGID